MPPDIRDLGIDKLSVPERLELAESIWQSVADEERGEDLTPGQMAELNRRLAKHDANPDAGKPWEVIRDRLLAKVRQ